jgi:hypothetical protein
VLGGAMARVPVEATAFAHRRSRIMVNVAAVYERQEEGPKHRAWVDALAAALRQGDEGAYVVSSRTRARPGSIRRTPARPGTGWPRSRPDTTPQTSSA